jgi:hypothetical protein
VRGLERNNGQRAVKALQKEKVRVNVGVLLIQKERKEKD